MLLRVAAAVSRPPLATALAITSCDASQTAGCSRLMSADVNCCESVTAGVTATQHQRRIVVAAAACWTESIQQCSRVAACPVSKLYPAFATRSEATHMGSKASYLGVDSLGSAAELLKHSA
jgi:hypothetical protein